MGKHQIDIYFGELKDTIDVELKANPVKSVKLLSLEPSQYTLGDPDYFAESGNGWVMKAIEFGKYQLEVTYTDGTVKVLTEADETDFRGVIWLLDGMIVGGGCDGEKVYTAPGKNKVYMTFMGQEAEFQVDIVEQAVVNGSASVSEATVNKLLEEKKGSTVTLNVAQSDTVVSSVKLPVASVEKLMEEKVEHLVVELGTATVTLDAKALAAIAEQAEGATITLSVEPVKVEDLTEKQQAALKNKNVEAVLTALVLSDGEPIGDFKGGSVKVKISFKPVEGYNYKVVYVADDGKTTDMTTEVDDDSLSFWTNHFSDYVIVKEEAKAGNSEVPNTADQTGVVGMTVMMLVSGTMAAALWLSLRKRNAV